MPRGSEPPVEDPRDADRHRHSDRPRRARALRRRPAQLVEPRLAVRPARPSESIRTRPSGIRPASAFEAPNDDAAACPHPRHTGRPRTLRSVARPRAQRRDSRSSTRQTGRPGLGHRDDARSRVTHRRRLRARAASPTGPPSLRGIGSSRPASRDHLPSDRRVANDPPPPVGRPTGRAAHLDPAERGVGEARGPGQAPSRPDRNRPARRTAPPLEHRRFSALAAWPLRTRGKPVAG